MNMKKKAATHKINKFNNTAVEIKHFVTKTH